MYISIIMPAFMAERWISRAIKSVINQTYTNWELLIVDSDSSDNTGKIATSFANIDPRIKYFNVPNVGASGARNAAIKKSSGKLIAYLDADDEYLAEHIEFRVNYFKQNTVDFIFGPVIESKNNNLNVYQGRLEGDENDCVLPLMVMHHRECFSVGTFNEKLVFEEDLDLWHRMIKRYKTKQFTEPATAIYHVHGYGMHSLYEEGGEDAIIEFRNKFKKGR